MLCKNSRLHKGQVHLRLAVHSAVWTLLMPRLYIHRTHTQKLNADDYLKQERTQIRVIMVIAVDIIVEGSAVTHT